MENAPLEIKKVTVQVKKGLENLFSALQDAGYEKWFHPHPLNGDEAARISVHKGEDLYYAMVEGDKVLAYGMLRGWDEGFPIPSLGLAVHPEVQGTGLGRVFMYFLHAAARRKGARMIKLKVHPNNLTAIELYKALGYKFADRESDQLVGIAVLE